MDEKAIPISTLISCPSFSCEICKRPVGASARKTDGEWQEWEPETCYWCQYQAAKKAAAKRRRECPRALTDVDIDVAVAELRRLPVLADLLDRKRIEVLVRHHAEGSCGGRAWPRRRRINVYGGPATTPERVLEVVLHELCHVATPGHGHDERFRRVFQRALREAWGIEVSIDVERGTHKNASYRMGEIAVEALRKMIADGVVIVSRYATTPTAPKTREEKIADTVNHRAAHALKMLKQAERRLKIARSVHNRWRAKVSYYERVAAKKMFHVIKIAQCSRLGAISMKVQGKDIRYFVEGAPEAISLFTKEIRAFTPDWFTVMVTS